MMNGIAANGGNMARKGVRAASVSHVTKVDAGDALCEPLKPFLAILHVSFSLFLTLFLIMKT